MNTGDQVFWWGWKFGDGTRVKVLKSGVLTDKPTLKRKSSRPIMEGEVYVLENGGSGTPLRMDAEDKLFMNQEEAYNSRLSEQKVNVDLAVEKFVNEWGKLQNLQDTAIDLGYNIEKFKWPFDGKM